MEAFLAATKRGLMCVNPCTTRQNTKRPVAEGELKFKGRRTDRRAGGKGVEDLSEGFSLLRHVKKSTKY